jgi:hypothetical protein
MRSPLRGRQGLEGLLSHPSQRAFYAPRLAGYGFRTSFDSGVQIMFSAGDWVQSLVDVTEEDFMGHAVWYHAHPNAIGHVLEVLEDGWLLIFFERTETISACLPEEIKRLGDAQVGRVQF